MSKLATRLVAVALSSCVVTGAAAAEPLRVVASFSILGDLVSAVGGEEVEVVTLVGPDGDAHVYAPTPAAARQVAEADLMVVNGLGFEGWLDRLVEASGYAGPVAVVSEGDLPVTVVAHEEGEEHVQAAPEDAAGAHEEHHHDAAATDPHAWQAVGNVQVYVGNIADALCAADAVRCDLFRANAESYSNQLAALDAEIKAGFEPIPPESRKVITTHDAFGYFGRAYGVDFLAPQGVSTDAEASAADVARLITQVRDEGVTALFLENVSDPRLGEQIARETGVAPGGQLFSDALSPAEGSAPTYLEMMRHNARLLQTAMQAS